MMQSKVRMLKECAAEVRQHAAAATKRQPEENLRDGA